MSQNTAALLDAIVEEMRRRKGTGFWFTPMYRWITYIVAGSDQPTKTIPKDIYPEVVANLLKLVNLTSADLDTVSELWGEVERGSGLGRYKIVFTFTRTRDGIAVFALAKRVEMKK